MRGGEGQASKRGSCCPNQQYMQYMLYPGRRVPVLTTGLFLTHMARLPNCSDCRVSSACCSASATQITRVVLALPPRDSCMWMAAWSDEGQGEP